MGKEISKDTHLLSFDEVGVSNDTIQNAIFWAVQR